MIKRHRRIEIRATEEEYKTLQANKTKSRLAEWLRELGLNQEQKSRHNVKTVDPKLLAELNRIGVNLNQIARHCNTFRANADLASIAIRLRAIENHLNELINDDREVF